MGKLTVGITGMAGFMGSHLRDRLKQEENIGVPNFEDRIFDDEKKLEEYVYNCDVIVHLAAMNRGDDDEIYDTNIELVNKLVSALNAVDKKPHILFSSSTQIERDNPYGRSKKEGARILKEWGKGKDASISILVIPNVFGDSGRPFYNSVIATFCYQVTHGEEPTILKDGQMALIYINDLVDEIYNLIKEPKSGYNVEYIKPRAKVKVSQVLALLNRFKDAYYNSGMVPEIRSDFERDMYNTFITYMDQTDWQRNLKLNTDQRGSFVEVFKLEKGGQVSFSTTKPGITRGNHYHIRKNEKFCVVSGQASIKLRRIGTDKVIEYKVSGDEPSWLEMPIYYTHNITNTGDTELVTLFWINEHFNPNNPDTYYEEV